MFTDKPVERKLKRDARREAIMQGAARAFVQHGFEATSLDDIARETGVSRVLMYRHFDSKEALYRAILENFRTRLPEIAIDTDLRMQGPNRIDLLIAAAKADPDGFRLVFRHAPREPEFKKYFDALQTRRTTYLDTSLQGLIPNKKQRAFAVALVSSIVINTLLTWIDAGMPEPDKISDIIHRLVRAAISVQ